MILFTKKFQQVTVPHCSKYCQRKTKLNLRHSTFFIHLQNREGNFVQGNLLFLPDNAVKPLKTLNRKLRTCNEHYH